MVCVSNSGISGGALSRALLFLLFVCVGGVCVFVWTRWGGVSLLSWFCQTTKLARCVKVRNHIPFINMTHDDHHRHTDKDRQLPKQGAAFAQVTWLLA